MSTPLGGAAVTVVITSHRSTACIRVSVTGDLDMATTPQLDRAITDALTARAGGVLVDLAATTFCDCAAITTLLVGRRHALAGDVSYQVINPTGICLKILKILHLHTLLTTRTPTSADHP